MANENCIGCDRPLTKPSTFIAVVNDGTKESPVWAARGVCDRCHQDPKHRNTTIKGHFFPRARAEEAVAAAGSSSIVAE